jgi:virginiamycin B lyase
MIGFCALAAAGCGTGGVITGGAGTPAATPTPSVSFEYSVPTASSAPQDIISASGFLYFTERAASKIAQLSTTGSFTEIATKTANAQPWGIAGGSNGNYWYTEKAAAKIGTVLASSFTVSSQTEYAVPWSPSSPNEITSGTVPQNTLYFTDPAKNAIGGITTSGVFSGPFVIPTANSGPEGITAGPNNEMWFTEYAAGKIGAFDPSGNTFTEYPLAAGAKPYRIIEDSAGALWFTDNGATPQLGHITNNGIITEYPLTGAGSATGLTQDAFGDIDVVDAAKNAIGVFNPGTLKFAEYPITTANSGASSIVLNTSGGDGKTYFTETSADKIGQFSIL